MNPIHLSSSCLLLLLLHLFMPLHGQIESGLVGRTYRQRLDHFSYTPERDLEFFDQRYFVNTRYWNSSGWNGKPPIFVYTGGEWDITVDLVGDNFPMHVASRSGALVVFMEHRYFGDSNPFGSVTEAYKNGSTLGYLDAAQALADFAEITLHVVKSYCPKSACPVIAMGCSYGGMLAAWFRLKYPHLVVGALASSAPVLAPNGDVTSSRSSYYDVASQVFENISQLCYSTIKDSWAAIDDAVALHGLPYLKAHFNLCNHLNYTSDLKDFLRLEYLKMAQYYNHLDPQAIRFCDGVTNGTHRPTIERIRDGLRNYYVGVPCVKITSTSNSPAHLPLSPGTDEGWAWQTCTEMVFPFGSHPPKTMFEPFFYNYSCSKAQCMSDYGITPRPAWISTTFNVSSHLDGFAGNIIFSNGRKDPYSVEGILSDISSTIVALVSEGAHCTDIGCIDPRDPQWLTDQRDEAIKIMEGWILNYHP
uniref:Lysosomal Pro-X carboxypeptidase n=1 Tax=Anthurium amnicola TaxID=1678845 RepID=A0A1D1YR05_9ARAE